MSARLLSMPSGVAAWSSRRCLSFVRRGHGVFAWQ
jgi:hypothetical protein